jgi:hypothetical protein
MLVETSDEEFIFFYVAQTFCLFLKVSICLHHIHVYIFPVAQEFLSVSLNLRLSTLDIFGVI